MGGLGCSSVAGAGFLSAGDAVLVRVVMVEEAFEWRGSWSAGVLELELVLVVPEGEEEVERRRFSSAGVLELELVLVRGRSSYSLGRSSFP